MLITTENVGFGYDDKRILENVSFTVNEGERIGLIGGNGEGIADYYAHKDKVLGTGLEVWEYEGGYSYHGKSVLIDVMRSVLSNMLCFASAKAKVSGFLK